MKLPNGERAVVDVEKLRAYCLGMEHRRGRNKARVFAASLGVTADGADDFRNALLEAVRGNGAGPADVDEYGSRYVVDFLASGRRGQAVVGSLWMIRGDEDFPRFIGCYVL